MTDDKSETAPNPDEKENLDAEQIQQVATQLANPDANYVVVVETDDKSGYHTYTHLKGGLDDAINLRSSLHKTCDRLDATLKNALGKTLKSMMKGLLKDEDDKN